MSPEHAITIDESVRIRERLHKLEQYPNLVEANHKIIMEIDQKLHKDANGQPSWQTRLDRLEQLCKQAVWIAGVAMTATIGQIIVGVIHQFSK